MRNVYKKLGLGILTAALLSGVICGGVSVSALEPPTYDFDHWYRQGDTSACVPKPAEDFLELTFETGEEISPENYTVAAAPNGMFYGRYYEDATIITLKEEYLQTLADGYYRLESHFFAEESYAHDVTDASLRPYGIEFLGISSFYRVTRITYDGQNIDPSYYTATDENGYQQILFNDKEYWKTLQSAFELLKVYFAPDYLLEASYLSIATPEPASEETPSSAPPAVSSEAPASAAQTVSDTPPSSAQPASSDEGTPSAPPAVSALSGGGAPESGNASTGSGRPDALAAGALLLLPLSAAGCLVLILLQRRRNNQKHM